MSKEEHLQCIPCVRDLRAVMIKIETTGQVAEEETSTPDPGKVMALVRPLRWSNGQDGLRQLKETVSRICELSACFDLECLIQFTDADFPVIAG